MENGQYKYSGRSRLFAELGTLDFGTEIMRNVSGILQFQTASKSEAVVTDLYYAGCEEEDFEVSIEDLHTLNLTVHAFGEIDGVHMPVGHRTSDWLLCIGAMMNGVRGGRSMNLAAFYQNEDAGDTEGGKSILRQLLPVAVVFILCAVIFGVVQVRKISLENKLQEKENWIAEMSVSEEYREALISERQVWQIAQTIPGD